MNLEVRPLRPSDLPATSQLHGEVLQTEFLARSGGRFLLCYHRAWLDSADAIAFCAVGNNNEVVGLLLGSFNPERHYRSMVRRHGVALTCWMLARAATHPRFGIELVATRAARYTRGLRRVLRPPAPIVAFPPETLSETSGEAFGGASGEITHLMVRPDARGNGAGRALLLAAQHAAVQAGLDELELVTPPALSAQGFYEHLGWHRAGEVLSRSGEHFSRYRWHT